MQAWGVYWLKHVFAIESFTKFGASKSEDIEGRFVDLINYCYLGLALIQDAADEATANALEEDIDAKKSNEAKDVSEVRADGAPRSDAGPAESSRDGGTRSLRSFQDRTLQLLPSIG